MRVAFVDQVGAAAGGAEKTLGLFLKHRPADIDASAILFEDGAFAEYLRSLDVAVDVIDVPASLARSKRETMPARGALAIPATALRVAARLRARRVDLMYTNSMKAHLVGSPRRALELHALRHALSRYRRRYGSARAPNRSSKRVQETRCRVRTSSPMRSALGQPPQSTALSNLRRIKICLPRAEALRVLNVPGDLPIVTLVGRINRWKGHDRFVRIAARVNAEVPARFLIVGAPIFRDADFVPELEALVAELGVASRVTFVQWVEDVRSVYAASDINVNTSTREPLGRTAAEAAAAGVPTICFDDSGAAETIVSGVTGEAIVAGDEAAFARAIVHYLRDDARRIAAGDAARRAATQFDAPHIAQQMAHVMRTAARE